MNICVYIYEYVFFFIRWYIIYAYLAISCMQIHNSKHKQTPQIIRFESKYMIGILHSSSQLYTVYLCFSNIVEVAAIFILQSILYNFATRQMRQKFPLTTKSHSDSSKKIHLHSKVFALVVPLVPLHWCNPSDPGPVMAPHLVRSALVSLVVVQR